MEKSQNSTIDDIINWYYNDSNFDKLIRKYTDDETLYQDAKQEIAIIIFNYNRKKIFEMWYNEELTFFIIKIIKNTLISKSSPYYRKFLHHKRTTEEFKQNSNQTIYDRTKEEESLKLLDEKKYKAKEFLIKRIKNYLEDKEKKSTQDYHDANIYKLYYFENMTYREIQEVTKIKHVYAYHSCVRVHTEILEAFKNDIDIIEKIKNIQDNDIY